MREVPRVRSKLFVPGNRREWMEKAGRYHADALVLDLEDSVPASEKDKARQITAQFISEHGAGTVLFVRINELTSLAAFDDLRAVVGPGLTGVIVPKVEGPEDIRLTCRILSWLEVGSGLRDGHTLISPVLETAAGIRCAYQIGAASSRIAYMGGIGVKGGDEERSLGYRWSPEGMETFVLRSQVLVDVRAAKIPNPMTGLWTAIEDLEGLRRFAEQGRNIGYEGMTAIHPSHVSVINEVFSLSGDDVEYFRGLLLAMEAAEAEGKSATIFRGAMVDTAMAKTARFQLQLASVEKLEVQ